MHVIEIFLPQTRNDGSDQPRSHFEAVRRELVERFGGLTAFTRAPAEGLWEDAEGDVARDRIVIFEVLADTIDKPWWSEFRARLQVRFEQEEILIRASVIERL